MRPTTPHGRRQPVGLIVDAVQRLVEDAGDQVDGIGYGEHLQQEAGRSTDRVIATQYDDAQQVAGDAESAERSNHVDLDDEFELIQTTGDVTVEHLRRY